MHVIFHSLGGNVIRDSVESTEVIPAPLNCQYSSIRNVGFLYTNNVSKPCSIAMATIVPLSSHHAQAMICVGVLVMIT